MLLAGNEPVSVRAEILLLLLQEVTGRQTLKKRLSSVPPAGSRGSAPSLTGLTHLPPAQRALMSSHRQPRIVSSRPGAHWFEALLPVSAFIKDFTADRTMAAQWNTERHIPGIRQVVPLKDDNLVSRNVKNLPRQVENQSVRV